MNRYVTITCGILQIVVGLGGLTSAIFIGLAGEPMRPWYGAIFASALSLVLGSVSIRNCAKSTEK